MLKQKSQTPSDTWITPKSFFDELNSEFNFDSFDPCPPNNDITVFDGLQVPWANTTFCNPPYSRSLKEAFLLKGFKEYQLGKTIVFLLPVSTGTRIFHNLLLKHGQIDFIRGRLKFEGLDSQGNHINPGVGMYPLVVPDNAPKMTRSGQFDSMLWVLKA